MRILVAGGAGFVGSHLVDELATQGHEVVVVDDFSTGSLENLAPIASRRIRVHRMDVADVPPTDRFDRVYHLASPASPDAYGRRPIDTLMVNAVGTRRLLDIARASRARFLLASTSEVYGDPLEHPQAETYWGNVDPIGPRSQYDEGKRFAEALTIAFVRQYQINARIVRIFNAYGPRMAVDDGRMPSSFIVAALRGDPIPVHGDGSQTRSLCYVEDTAAGLIAAMERGASGEVYNIGRADEVTVHDFAERVRRAAASRSPIVQIEARPQEIRRRCPDPTKAERALGWSPQTSLDQGIDRTIAWYRSRLTVGERIA